MEILIAGKAEIIITTEIQLVAAVETQHPALGTFHDAPAPIHIASLQFFEPVSNVPEGSHVIPLPG